MDERVSIVKVEPHGNYVVGRIVCPSVSQREAPIIETEMIAAGPGSTWRMLLDCGDVGMLSSVGLGTLITLHKKCSEGKGRLVVFGLSKEIGELVKITKLDKLLTIVADEKSALAKVKA